MVSYLYISSGVTYKLQLSGIISQMTERRTTKISEALEKRAFLLLLRKTLKLLFESWKSDLL